MLSGDILGEGTMVNMVGKGEGVGFVGIVKGFGVVWGKGGGERRGCVDIVGRGMDLCSEGDFGSM